MCVRVYSSHQRVTSTPTSTTSTWERPCRVVTLQRYKICGHKLQRLVPTSCVAMLYGVIGRKSEDAVQSLSAVGAASAASLPTWLPLLTLSAVCIFSSGDPCSAGMCTIEGNTCTTAATSTTQHTATTGYSQLCQPIAQAL